MTCTRLLLRTLLVCALSITVACNVGVAKPTVVIASPPHGSQFHEGEDIAVHSTATDAQGVVRVELVVDGSVVRSDDAPTPQGQRSFTLVQSFKATPGSHTISVRAFNSSSAASDPAAISVTVTPAVAVVNTAVTPTLTNTVVPSPTPIPPTVPALTPTPTIAAATVSACTNNSAFVADVTVPDGTPLAMGQPFNKIWRIRNNGTCAWEAGYQLVLVGGEAMTNVNAIPVPATAPGATADLLIPMTASITPGTHSGQWRLKASSGALFGITLSVVVNILSPGGPPPPSCTGTPIIESFTASPSTIAAGASSTLAWGAVANAEAVQIDPEIGGVATPGNASVSPGSTTTYTLTARCGANTATRQVAVTVTVAPAAKPDLYVSEFSLNPNPPVQNQNVHVRVGVYNQGNAAATTPFVVEWWAGSNYPAPACSWTVNSLAAHGGRILECDKGSGTWASAYGSITTRVKVDPTNTVAEGNESNNIKDTSIQVLAGAPPAQADLYVSAFSLNPNPPNHSAAVTVQVTVYNQGNAAATVPFTVQWFAGSGYASPACSWTVNSMAAGGGQVLSCNKPAGTWASNYANITTRVKVDTGNTISESNEGNNTYDKAISVQ